MAIQKDKAQIPYVIIEQTILHDKRLSLAERGLIVTLLSLADGWDFSTNGLVAILSESNYAIEGLLKSIEQKGYLTRERMRDDKGHYVKGMNVRIRQRPVLNPHLENPDVGNRDVENQDVENPPLEIQKQYINKYKFNNKKNKNNKKQIPQAKYDFELLEKELLEN